MQRLLVDVVLCFAVLASTGPPVCEGQNNPYKYNSISKYPGLDKWNRGSLPECHERPLEVRERNADVIFTGTIRQLLDPENDGLRRAKVQIKRVMKGGHILSRLPRIAVDDRTTAQDHRKVVVVEGIGDPAICHSQAKTHDTRIFLVNKASNGQLRLNSSLVRITLDNIEKAEAAVKDMVFKPTTRYYYTKPPMEKKDPCRDWRCSYGARCVASLDGLTPRCQCPERCDSFGDSVGSGFVCGSDGRDYANLCELKRKACEEMKDIDRKYEGRCDPCDGFVCPASQVCQLDSGRRPVCGCDALCPMVFEPVCGSNGRTYSNECLMKVDACKRRMEIWLMFRGECTSGKNPCHGVSCGSTRICVVDASHAAHCTCPRSSCDPILRPVCASDGRTYPSECHLLRHSCDDENSHVTVSHVGECNTISVCTNHVCQNEAARCVIQDGQPVCVCPACSEEYQPVCGSNGVSYMNECKMKTENCEKSTNVTFAYAGLCDACKHKRCEFYSECVNDGRNGPICVCPATCDQEVNANVCGSDGITYGSECELRLHSCRLQHRIFPISQGPCDPCADVKCNFGAKCLDGRCMCDYDCANATDPICGSDGLTYSNECVMQRVACSQGVEIEALHAGNCQESSESSGSGDGPMGNCDAQRCRYGGTCRPGRRGELECVCTFNCDAVRSPVCGSDGRTHGNECQLKEESCRKQLDISVLPMDNCEDIFEELCDGKPALVDRLTGTEYECSDSTGCPAGSYCHWQSGIGKCCGGDLPIRSCSETKYGCCPDGLTSASGPRNNGCQDGCQCHSLGSDGNSCDPITRQCSCKEGVGGLRCDRCNPSYWGLPKISEGNKGCIPCDCNVLGSMRDDCEQTTGRCTCRPGITGQKCNICPNGRQLDSNGCADLMFSDRLNQALTCADKQCRFGAVCQMTNGVPECICPASCQPQDDLATMVCGSDDQTYGSSCQLKRSACRLQKDIRVASRGPCQKITTTRHMPTMHTNNPPASAKSKNAMNSPVRITKDLTNPTNDLSNYVFGTLDDFCEENRDCFVTGSYCKNGLCSCQSSLLPSNDKRTCIAERFFIPSFNGRSYLQLKRFSYASRDVSIEIQFQPQRENGILFYAGQGENGTGDFLALSLRNGHVEFRYDLGSGAAILKTPEKIKVGTFHRVTARRFGKDGILKLDDGPDVSSTSPGMMRSLNLVTPIYLGSLPNITHVLSNNTGVRVGFVGCVESLSVKSSERSVTYDLTQDNAGDIEYEHDVHECGVSSCAGSPCLNGGQCLELDAGINFECSCPTDFSGVRCDERKKSKRSLSCSSNPCQNGGSCLQLDSGNFVCNCPSSHDGDRCEKAFKRELLHPYSTALQFHGDSFIMLRLSKAASRSFSFEIWFLPIQPDGVLLYSAQENVAKGDFVSLHMVDSFLQLRYDLGSGIANITSQTTVRLGMWNKVVVSRLHRLGSLSLNDDHPSKGQSAGGKRELNLPTRIYVGGYPNDFNPESGARSGFVGAIQKFFRDRKLVENLLTESLSTVHITQYVGPPCPLDNSPCHNGGTCVPNLNDFECQCPDSFYGITCQTTEGNNASGRHHSIGFDGHTHHRYSVTVKERSPETFHVEMTFRTKAADGLLLIHKWDTTDFGYVAIAVRGGRIQASFNVGREKSSKSLSLVSRSSVADDRRHNVTFIRIHNSAHLYVDHDLSTVPVPATAGSTHLGPRGYLLIGGNAGNKPHGLPKAFYVGFKGCVESVAVGRQTLSLVDDRDQSVPISFCNADI